MKGFRPGHVPLERALSKLGIASRTQARQWITEGKVKVNGVLRLDPQFSVFPERARIEIEEKRIEAAEFRSFIFHKPRGVVTTRSDEKGRPTVFEFLKDLGVHLIAVGRLDWATSGLLILTNHTQFANWLTDPINQVRRVYLVTVRGKVTENQLDTIRQGLLDQDDLLQADEVVLRKSSQKESHLTITLSEGKNREIRRIFSALDHEVTRLKRVAYGPLELADLKPGEYREITEEKIRTVFPSAPWSQT